jgi:hypothetical protein
MEEPLYLTEIKGTRTSVLLGIYYGCLPGTNALDPRSIEAKSRDSGSNVN